MDADPAIIPLLERARPLLPKFQDLLHVERAGLPPLVEGGKPVFVMTLHFHPIFDTTTVHTLSFVMDPDGAREYGLADDDQIDALFNHFSPESPVEQSTEESA